MAKPLSRPNEVGRAIGYNVDIALVIEKLQNVSLGNLDSLKSNRAFLQEVGQAMQAESGDKPGRIWIVVKIERGVPVMMDAYRNKRSANARERFLRAHMHPETDDVALLDIKL